MAAGTTYAARRCDLAAQQRNPAQRRRNPVVRRRLAAGLVASALVITGVGAFTALVWPGYAVARPAATNGNEQYRAAAVQLSREPAPRVGEQTELMAAVPDYAGVWAQAKISAYLGWQNTAGAVEAWTISYTDARQNKMGRLEVTVGQWASGSAALAFYRSQVRLFENEFELEPELSGEVTQAATGQVAGSYSIWLALDDDGVPTPGKGVMWWRNGTVVVRVTGPTAELAAFYSVYPL